MKGAWLQQDGPQTKLGSAVFLAANQNPVLWRVAHKKQSGKKGNTILPCVQGGGVEGKAPEALRDCSESTDERLNTTF